MRFRLPHDITLWSVGTPDGYGNTSFNSPVVFKGRWEDTQENFINAKGEEVLSRSIIYAERSFPLAGKLKKGNHAGESTPPEDAMEIGSVKTSPNLAGTQELTKVWL